ncbi:MAG: glycosyl hydrolase 2 galactose-binding domain-containing protein, partial [Demequina sp.]|uniref:glycosyl hydrolase 2 galactose-binding domain-containing protein n=1 Tax=Demequina sp. TaxID=2050685 RepID=UPI003A8A4E19
MTARQATRTPQTRWTLDLTHAAPSAPGSVIDALTGGIGVAVPGSVLGALIERGLATDVTVDGHEADVEWAAQSTWTYRTQVARTGDGADVTLVLEGVDTFGTVRVDG